MGRPGGTEKGEQGGGGREGRSQLARMGKEGRFQMVQEGEDISPREALQEAVDRFPVAEEEEQQQRRED